MKKHVLLSLELRIDHHIHVNRNIQMKYCWLIDVFKLYYCYKIKAYLIQWRILFTMKNRKIYNII